MVLKKATEQHDLVDDLEPLEESVLLDVLNRTAEAFSKALAVPVRDLVEDDVRELYVSLLRALHATHPQGSLQPHDTHATRLRGMLKCKPDIVVSDCELALPPHVVEYYEIKSQLAEGSAQEQAAYQVDQRCSRIKPHQPSREVFWACSGGLDAVQLWRFEREGVAARVSPLLPLSPGKDSLGLQAIVRLWCTPASKKGYVAPPLPSLIELQQDQRRLRGLEYMTMASSPAEGTDTADVTSVVLGRLEPDNTPVVAKTTSNEERLEQEVRV